MQAPRSLPRIVPLPDANSRRRLVALSTIVEAFVAHLFEGVQVQGCYQFRLTRNGDLFVDDEEVDDLRRALEGELAQLRSLTALQCVWKPPPICPGDMVDFLLHEFALTPGDCYQVPGPVNLNRFSAIYDLAQRTDLKYPTASHPGFPRPSGGRHRPVCSRSSASTRRTAASSVPQLRSRDGLSSPGSD